VLTPPSANFAFLLQLCDNFSNFSLSAVQKFWFSVLESRRQGRLAQLLSTLLIILIIANVLVAALETVEVLRAQFKMLFSYFEEISLVVFIIEYLTRVWVAPLHKDFISHLHFMLRPAMLFDLLVIAPFCLVWAFPELLPMLGSIVALRMLRLFRIVRVLSRGSFRSALERLIRVIHKEREGLASAFLLIFVLLTISSSLLYLVESGADNSKFTSIPMTMYWGVATLTTVGYGDFVPQTELGRLIASLTMLLNIGALALPTSILGASFYRELTNERTRDLHKVTKQVVEMQKDVASLEKEISSVTEQQGTSTQPVDKKKIHDFVADKHSLLRDVEHKLWSMLHLSSATNDHKAHERAAKTIAKAAPKSKTN